MNETFLFGVFPYAAAAVAGVGIAMRQRSASSSGTRSSEFLEKRALFWGSVPWHYAVLAILLAHLVAAVAPATWGGVVGDPGRLVVLEVVGVALGIWATFAMALLIVRRAASARLRSVTTPVDWILLALLLLQVATGTWIGLTLRWGSIWFLHTAAPWLGSLLALSPRTELAALLPTVVKVHAISAFVLLALVPFSRLVHALAAPLGYLSRPFQVVIWNRARIAPRATGRVLHVWQPEDLAFWRAEGQAIANRNLWISIPALFLSFAVWMVWSVVVVRLPAIGFRFTTDQLFWLAALPGLSGATLRIFYAFIVPVFGGRMWTVLSTASLLGPAVGMGLAVQDPTTSYRTMLLLALLSGLGGGNFASSMANISFFFPKERKGTALGLNAGLGNLGVSGMQFLVPLAITSGVFGALGGPAQVVARTGERIWLQNAGFVWVPFVLAATAAAWLGMNDIASARASFREQAVVFRRPDNWLMCWLYIGTFGSFIGFSAALPLLVKAQFPGVDPIRYAFLGPLVGALLRPLGGWLSDRLGGARVTLWNFVAMAAAAGGVLLFLPAAGRAGSFPGFLAMFLVLFATSGIGNGSTFRMIPVIFATLHERRAAGRPAAALAQARKDAAKEGAAVIGFSSAVAAYGAFFIPTAFGQSMTRTGSPAAAFLGFIAVYLSCIAVAWWRYARRRAAMPC